MVAAVFLDVKSAYDNVNVECFINHMNKIGFSADMCEIMWNLMKSRINKYEVNGKIIDSRTSHVGLAQGLPLSPIEYNLATNMLENCLEDNIKCIQLADDIVIYSVTKNMKDAEEMINKTIKNLVKEISKIGLNYSIAKCESIVFTRKHENPEIKIKINQQDVRQVTEVRYLGVLIDRKLLMTKHINNVASAGKKILNIMRSTAGVSWGADSSCLDMLYKGISRSRMEFCSFVYPQNKSLRKLEQVQWKAARIISGCMTSTPTNALEVLTALPPLKIRFEKLNYKFWCIINSQPNHPLQKNIKKLQKMGNNFLCSHYNVVLYKFEYFPFFSKEGWQINDVIDLEMQELIGNKKESNPLIAETYAKEILNKKYKEFKIIFTDGSKIKDSTSAAFYELNGCEKKIKLALNHSIFTGECIGIYQALDHMQQIHKNIKKICVVTDNISACQAIKNATNSFKNHHIVSKICEKINQITYNGGIVKIVWAPSHCGIMGNERADKLANLAHENPDCIIETKMHFREEAEYYYHTEQLQKWQNEWKESEKGRFLFSIMPNIKKSLSIKILISHVFKIYSGTVYFQITHDAQAPLTDLK